MDRFEAMGIFVASVETGTFTGAGRKLAMPLATVSRKISDLETLLGVRLLNRSTRKLELTEIGATYLAHCKQILEQVSDAEREAAGEYVTPRGELVVTAPIVFGRLHVVPVVGDFLATYPDISVRLVFADPTLQMAEEQVDVAIRIGRLPDSSMVTTQVGGVCRVVAASPAFLANHGVPKTPSDVTRFPCINFDALASGPSWRFANKNRRGEITVPIRPRMVVNTAESAIEAAIRGVGLTHVLSYQATRAVQEKKLQLVLRDYEPDQVPVSLIHPGQGALPAKTRLFFEFAVPRLQEILALDQNRPLHGDLKVQLAHKSIGG